MIKVCIIGCGMIANNAHIPAYLNNKNDYCITAVADYNSDVAKKTAEKHHIDAYYQSVDEMLNIHKPDLVSVCTPNLHHKEFVKKALEAGANVLCEKPLATTYKDAKELFDLAQKNGKVLMACQSLRFLPERLAAKKIVDDGIIGDIYYAEFSRIRSRGIPTWGKFHIKSASGGGALLDIGVHSLDSTLWLMGNPKPTSVTATMHKVHSGEMGDAKSSGALKGGVDTKKFNPNEMDVESFASGTVCFENGASLNFKVSWASNLREENNIVLSGKDCGIDLENQNLYAHGNNPAKFEVAKNGFETEPFFGHFCLVENMADVLLRGKTPFVLPEETLNVTAIIEAAYRSAEQKCTVDINTLIR